jgi:hypothetical protein
VILFSRFYFYLCFNHQKTIFYTHFFAETLLCNAIGVVIFVVSVACMFFIARAITCKLMAKTKSKESSSGEREVEKSSLAGSHRSRASRAQSRSRSPAAIDQSAATTDYRLMDREDDNSRKDENNTVAVEYEAAEAAVDDPSCACVAPHLDELPLRSHQDQTTCWSEKSKEGKTIGVTNQEKCDYLLKR